MLSSAQACVYYVIGVQIQWPTHVCTTVAAYTHDSGFKQDASDEEDVTSDPQDEDEESDAVSEGSDSDGDEVRK